MQGIVHQSCTPESTHVYCTPVAHVLYVQVANEYARVDAESVLGGDRIVMQPLINEMDWSNSAGV